MGLGQWGFLEVITVPNMNKINPSFFEISQQIYTEECARSDAQNNIE